MLTISIGLYKSKQLHKDIFRRECSSALNVCTNIVNCGLCVNYVIESKCNQTYESYIVN